MKLGIYIAAGLAATSAAVPAKAAVLLGQDVTYCTDSTYSGLVSLNPANCSTSGVSAEGTTTIVDPGVEITLGGDRFIDLSDDLITITYQVTGSPSPDLFVLTGLSGLTNLQSISDTLGVESVFSSSSIGFLISGNPSGPGTAQFRVNGASGAVPEPTTWAMMLIGFGAVGGAMRSAKRRKKVTVSYA